MWRFNCGESLLWRIVMWRVVIVANRSVVSLYCGVSTVASRYCGESLFGESLLWRIVLWRVVIVVFQLWRVVIVANRYCGESFCGESLLWRIVMWRVVIMANRSVASRYCGESLHYHTTSTLKCNTKVLVSGTFAKSK